MRKFADAKTTTTADHHDPVMGTPGKSTLVERIFRHGAGAPAGNAGDLVAAAQTSAGAPLPAAERTTFERSLGADLSSVRIHTGAASEQAAAGLGARAFAHGQDIHFGAGQYRPSDPGGQHLLAHEVAHTVQQGSGGGDVQAKLEVSEPGDAAEVEADRAADAMVSGAQATVTSSGFGAARKVQRVGLEEPAPAVPANAGGASRPMLRVGSTGPAVIELQQKLGVTADGQFGPQTRAAVVAFQQAHGLAADGVVGPMTWSALDSGGTSTKGTGTTGTGTGTTGTGTGTTGTGPGNTTEGKTGGTKDGTPAVTNEHKSGNEHTNEEPPGPATAGGARAAIVAAARGKIGTVFSDVAAEPDETGDKTRKGWETLTEIFSVAYPSFPKQIIKYIKYGKNNGKAGSNPNGLVSWCGIFATWAVMTGGGNCGTWDAGPRCSAMSKITRDPKPGDVGYFTANQHHCIIASVNGNQIETIDGNSYDGDSGGNGAITSRMRSRSDFAGFFKQVDD